LFPAAQRLKGVHYFDRNYWRGECWYRSHFPTSVHQRLVRGVLGHPIIAGEASPYYLIHPLAAQRAHALVPDARLIVLLRDPVERAFSHYRDEVKQGHEWRTFEQAIQEEPDRVRCEELRLLEDEHYYSHMHEHLSYLSYGHYGEHLCRWLSYFEREQLLVLMSEELFTDPRKTMVRVLRFLGLPSLNVRLPIRMNAAPTGELEPSTRTWLEGHYRPHIRDLRDLLGQPLPWRSASTA
jgi:hypothetical protein